MFEFENQLTSWIVISIMTLTASLVFYHMTRIVKPSLKVPPYNAALIVTVFILLNVVASLTALVPYNLRFLEKTKEEVTEAGFNYEHENSYRIVYTVVIAILVLVQLAICYYVITDAFERAR